jgi:hypothetical protein
MASDPHSNVENVERRTGVVDENSAEVELNKIEAS